MDRSSLLTSWSNLMPSSSPAVVMNPSTVEILAWTAESIPYAASVGLALPVWRAGVNAIGFERLASPDYAEQGLQVARRALETGAAAVSMVVYRNRIALSRVYGLPLGLACIETITGHPAVDAIGRTSLAALFGLSPRETDVLVACIDAANRRQVVRLQAIADAAGMSVRSVQRYLSRLKRQELVDVSRASRGVAFEAPAYGRWCADTVRWVEASHQD